MNQFFLVNSVVTEDKYGSSVPLEEGSSDEEEKKPKPQPEDTVMGMWQTKIAYYCIHKFIESHKYLHGQVVDHFADGIFSFQMMT